MSPVRRSIRGSEDSLKRTLSRCKGKKGVEHSVSLHGRTLLKFKAQLFLLRTRVLYCLLFGLVGSKVAANFLSGIYFLRRIDSPTTSPHMNPFGVYSACFLKTKRELHCDQAEATNDCRGTGRFFWRQAAAIAYATSDSRKGFAKMSKPPRLSTSAHRCSSASLDVTIRTGGSATSAM
jgi:hypothetical protein